MQYGDYQHRYNTTQTGMFDFSLTWKNLNLDEEHVWQLGADSGFKLFQLRLILNIHLFKPSSLVLSNGLFEVGFTIHVSFRLRFHLLGSVSWIFCVKPLFPNRYLQNLTSKYLHTSIFLVPNSYLLILTSKSLSPNYYLEITFSKSTLSPNSYLQTSISSLCLTSHFSKFSEEEMQRVLLNW